MQNKAHSFVFKTILFIYVLYSFMPVVAYYIPSIVRFFLALFLWGYYIIHRVSFRWFPLMIFPIILLIGYAISSQDQFMPQLYYIINLMTLAALCCSIVDRDDFPLAKQLVLLLLIAFVINSITTYYGNIKFPNASRLLASVKFAAKNYDTYQRLNIGGFDVIYSLTLSIPLAAISFKRKKRFINILSLMAAFLFLLAIIQSEYSISLVFALASCLLFIVPLKSNLQTLLFLIGIPLLLISLLGESFDVFSSISSLSGSEAVDNRMSDISDWLQGTQLDKDSDVSGRFEKYMLSLKGFLSSPIFGGMLSNSSMVGGHSFILDNLSKYGAIGLISMWLMFGTLFNKFFRIYSNCDFYYFSVLVFIEYVFLTLLNPQPFIPFVSFALPLYLYVLSKSTSAYY